jgi:flagellum-specific peptidoglycan hydrolase FlgJ
MKKFLLLTVMLGYALVVSAQKNTPQSYIEQYKADAIRIMHETGVPASIVLGVAMHESGCGNSALAKNLNNQFGVKGSDRNVYYAHKKKVSTSYKKYGSIYDSFQDFARILTERKEFSGLAESLTHFDYFGWAHGIQKHGYASSHKWATQVTGLIKKYQLYSFDENPADTAKMKKAN